VSLEVPSCDRDDGVKIEVANVDGVMWVFCFFINGCTISAGLILESHIIGCGCNGKG